MSGEVVEPAVRGVLYKTLARYTVREIFSSKSQEIQQLIEQELKPRLPSDGVVLESVTIGKVDLPRDYKAGMENLLAEGLATEKMRYTLERKDKQVRQSELEAEAEKIRREKAAEAAGQEQIIAAKAQAEAMKHVLPFKQKQIEQRGLEAEAEKGRPDQECRSRCAGAPDRGGRRSRFTPQTRRCRRLPSGAPRQGRQRTTCTRRRPDLRYAEVSEIIRTNMSAFLAGTKTAEAALADMNARLGAIFR